MKIRVKIFCEIKTLKLPLVESSGTYPNDTVSISFEFTFTIDSKSDHPAVDNVVSPVDQFVIRKDKVLLIS